MSFKHVSFWYPFLEPYLTTYNSNVSILIRKVTEWELSISSTQLSSILKYLSIMVYKVEGAQTKTLPNTNTFKSCIISTYRLWECSQCQHQPPPYNLGWQHNSHLKNLYLFQYLGNKWVVVHVTSFFYMGILFLVYITTTCVLNTLTSCLRCSYLGHTYLETHLSSMLCTGVCMQPSTHISFISPTHDAHYLWLTWVKLTTGLCTIVLYFLICFLLFILWLLAPSLNEPHLPLESLTWDSYGGTWWGKLEWETTWKSEHLQ